MCTHSPELGTSSICNSTLDELYEGLPVLIVQDWAEVTLERLSAWQERGPEVSRRGTDVGHTAISLAKARFGLTLKFAYLRHGATHDAILD